MENMNIYIITNNYFLYLGFSEHIKNLAKLKMLTTISNDMADLITPDDIIFISKDSLNSSPGIIIEALKLVDGKIENIFIDSDHENYRKLKFKTFNSRGPLTSIRGIILNLYRGKVSFSRYINLSIKETEVLFLLKKGIRGIDISRMWLCSPKTVYTHKCQALKKLGVKRFSTLISNKK
ncbi:helix-turn-helix domain-containing protein [Escherichia coli]|nr:helix-turn-helix domain-containing protein [Escherichia coli]